MASPGPSGPKRDAAEGAAAAAADGRLKRPVPPKRGRGRPRKGARGQAWALLEELGVDAERLKVLERVYELGFTRRDLLVLSTNLLLDAQKELQRAAADERAKALIQVDKALETMRKLVEAEEDGKASGTMQVLVRIAYDATKRRDNAGNGVKIVAAGSLK